MTFITHCLSAHEADPQVSEERSEAKNSPWFTACTETQLCPLPLGASNPLWQQHQVVGDNTRWGACWRAEVNSSYFPRSPRLSSQRVPGSHSRRHPGVRSRVVVQRRWGILEQPADASNNAFLLRRGSLQGDEEINREQHCGVLPGQFFQVTECR